MWTLIVVAAVALAQERVPTVHLGAMEVGLGSPDAPYTIVQFSDWQCPHCARAHDRMRALVEEDPTVRVVFKTYPLSGLCNPYLSTTSGEARCVLARGSVCAGEQGRWLDYATRVFADLGAWASATDASLVASAPALGLDASVLRSCLDSARPQQRVQADAGVGQRLEIRGTPTFFVRDRARGDWVRAQGGADGAVEALRALQGEVVEQWE